MSWEFKNDRPIYTQLVELLKKNIISGKYKPGDKLPSVRELATEAAVNPNTMQRAFAELEREGLVYSQRTSGRVITEDMQKIQEIKEVAAMEFIKIFLKDMRELGFEDEAILRLLQEYLMKNPD